MTPPLSGRIKVQTASSLAAAVAERWREQYGPTPRNERFADIQTRLDALGAKATAEEIEEIVGNKSWTSETCNLCDSDVYVWVRLGAPVDYETHTVYVCPDCLRAAVFVLETTETP